MCENHKICKPYNQIQNTFNTIVFAVYNSLKYLFDSVVDIEYLLVLGVEQGNKKYPSQ